MNKKQTLSIILPVFNEEKSLTELKSELGQLEKTYLKKYQITHIWIDDGSTDTSLRILKSFKNRKNIILSFARNFGKTQAIKAGFDKNDSDFIAIMDTDLQDNPSYIPSMLSKINSNKCDLIIGNRINRYQANDIKKISSRLIKYVLHIFFPELLLNDTNCGLKVMKASVSKQIYIKSDYHRYIPLIAYLRGFSVCEINIKQRNRKYGKSKYGRTGLGRSWKSFSDLLTIIFIYKFAHNPFSFFGKIGTLFCFFGIIILSYLTILWFGGQPINSRPLFFLGLLAVITGINFFSIGLLGDMIENLNNNQRYLLRD